MRVTCSLIVAVFLGVGWSAASEIPTAPAVNLHADFPMLYRDAATRSDVGVSDFPRMREAGIALVGASICPGGAAMRAFFWWQGWPAESRSSPLARAYAMIARVEAMDTADAATRIVRTRADLEAVRSGVTLGVLLTLEGGDVLADDPPARVREFYARGVRIASLTHVRDNALGGSGSPTIPGTNLHLHGDDGLTERGRAVLREMATHGMILDLAHASPRTFWDALAAWPGPMLVTHTAMAALYSSRRNVTDDQLRAVAARGGVVGINAQRQFLGGDHLADVAAHIVHAVRVVGSAHVALGLDMEEFTEAVLPTDFRDIRELPRLAVVCSMKNTAGQADVGAYP